MDKFSRNILLGYKRKIYKKRKENRKKYGHANCRPFKESRLQKGYGYIYVINCENSNFYKIGMTKNKPYARLVNLQVSCPHKLILKKFLKKHNPRTVEKRFAQKFKQYNIRGEWYQFDENMYFCALNWLTENKIS